MTDPATGLTLTKAWEGIKKVKVIWTWLVAAKRYCVRVFRAPAELDKMRAKLEQVGKPGVDDEAVKSLHAPSGWRLRHGIYWGR